MKSKSYLWKVFGVMDQNINYDSNRISNSADFVLIFCEKLPNTNNIIYKENYLVDFLIYTFDNQPQLSHQKTMYACER